MKISAPLVTLAAGALLAGGLVAANVIVTGDDDAVTVEAAAADTATGEATAAVAVTAEATAGADGPGAAEATVAADGAPDDAPDDAVDAAAPVTWYYKGKVQGTALTAAVAVTGDEAVAYVCDGDAWEIWLRGTATDGVLDVNGEAGQWLRGSVTPETVEGTFALDGQQWPVSASSGEWPDWAPPLQEADIDGVQLITAPSRY